jgi:hypothetical protein
MKPSQWGQFSPSFLTDSAGRSDRTLEVISMTAEVRDDVTPELRDAAVKQLGKKQDFHAHLLVYLLVNGVLWIIWALTMPGGFIWPVIPMAAWGVGLVMNVWDVYIKRPFTEAEIRAEVRRLQAGGRS